MRVRLVALSLALAPFLPACGDSAQDQLLGTWTLDAEGMRESEEYANASDMEKQIMDGMLESMSLRVTFTEDQMKSEISVMGMNETDAQPYSVKSSKGNTLVLVSSNEDGDEEEITVTIDGDRATFSDHEDSFHLKRVE